MKELDQILDEMRELFIDMNTLDENIVGNQNAVIQKFMIDWSRLDLLQAEANAQLDQQPAAADNFFQEYKALCKAQPAHMQFIFNNAQRMDENTLAHLHALVIQAAVAKQQARAIPPSVKNARKEAILRERQDIRAAQIIGAFNNIQLQPG